MSIVNGLFSGRAGIASHGAAIGVVGDNIANSSTTGFKAGRAEFADLLAGGQVSGRTIGSGSTVNSVTTIFNQGSLEFTSRPLDLAIDGNGFFTVADGEQRFYTRSGNFKIDSAGFVVDQNDYALLGFPQGGTGALQPLNINAVGADSARSTDVAIAGNLDASATALPGGVGDIPPPGSSYVDLENAAESQTVVEVFDSLGAAHSVTVYFFKTAEGEWTSQGYVDGAEVDGGVAGVPSLIGSGTMEFGGDGLPAGGDFGFTSTVAWSNGADPAADVDFRFDPFTQFAGDFNISAITQDGQGVGAVVNISIESNGDVFAQLDNGQSAVIGTVALTNFANPEGLQRVGKNLLIQSASSGEPLVGRPTSGTLGAIQAGSLELSTVDIASEFVKIITLQRGFQASSRIITTINQLLNEIIQLA